jgi:peptidoglycan/LPS O-acetylase OafA/YrhL
MGAAPAVAPGGGRLRWLDGIKGLAILWIAYFHCFETYNNRRLPSPLGADYFGRFLHQAEPVGFLATVLCVGKAAFAGIAGVGFHAVGVFIVMSGFGLSYSLARTRGPRNGWRGWYRSRLVRLFPVYWAAHLLYLVSPFVAHLEPLDYRFVLSFLGDRVWPIYYIFYYLNPAWWYFGLILELYIVFPLLYMLMRKLGPAWFMTFAIVETIVSRYVLMVMLHASGYYLLGAFFGCRLWEFALGMVIGHAYRDERARIDGILFSWSGLFAGIAIYTAGLYSFPHVLTYTMTDGLIGTGLFVILAQIAWAARRLTRIDAALAYAGVYSYGFYLVHQPYAIYFGERVRSLNLSEFTLAAIPVIAIIAIGSSWFERAVNAIANRLLQGASPVPASAPSAGTAA